MKILLVAPNVDATDVGEAYVAFKWAEALSERVELTVLTFQRSGRQTIADQLPNARVVTWPEPSWAMKHERLNAMLKPAWPVFAGYVRRWISARVAAGRTVRSGPSVDAASGALRIAPAPFRYSLHDRAIGRSARHPGCFCVRSYNGADVHAVACTGCISVPK